MDPISQGALGAAFAQAASPKRSLHKHNVAATLAGALAGMAADLDVLIRSASDPLLFLEYHRQFTHSLIFIPLGGLICAAAFFYLFRRWQLSFKHCYLWCTAGYASHGLLDACTSYGTLLLWPFSDFRVSWDIISIIDPLFTLPLLLAVCASAALGRRRYAVAGLGWILCYLFVGFVQHERVINGAIDLAERRGHEPTDVQAKPSFANILVWKTIYSAGDWFYVDAMKVGTGTPTVWEGDRILRLDVERDFPWLDPESQQARDIVRFNWFSSGFTAVDPQHPQRIIDIRYSMLPQRIKALWGIELSRDAAPDQHVEYFTARDSGRESAQALWRMLLQ